MSIFRRRTLFWLIKAYLKKWGKVIGSSFILGLLIFFFLLAFSQYVINKLPTEKKAVVGLIGAYTPQTLPPTIVGKVSRGLTSVDQSGSIHPGAAKSWEITDNGKTYIFHLQDAMEFSNGKSLTSELIRYDFADVRIERPNEKTLVFKLKDAYSPFLTTVSRPVFTDGLTGIGEYRITDLKLNGNFVERVELRSVNDALVTETYKFYPTEEALKQAFMLGEINTAVGLTDLNFRDTTFSSFPGVTISRQIDYSKLVSIFYNTKDSVISDKKLRNGLSYALPDRFEKGQRNYVSYPPNSEYFFQQGLERPQDMEHARLLIDASLETASQSAAPKLQMKVLSRYMNIAKEIQKAWKQAGIDVELESVEVVPTTFQIYLGDFNVPRDPDQYTLWHSSQGPNTNITNYADLRIDKLLEDGRKTTDIAKRKEIYADFQKYLLDDSPASFLYFPYSYTVERQ